MEKWIESRIGKEVKDFLFLLFGCLIAGIAINVFYIPSGFSMGGISGLAQSFYLMIGENSIISLGMMSMLLNVPILLMGWKVFGFKMVYRSIIGTVVFSFMIDFTAWFTRDWFQAIIGPLNIGGHTDRLVLALFGGVLFGLGLGVIFFGHYTTGGTDILAFVAKKSFPHLSIGTFIFVLDMIVIAIYVTTLSVLKGQPDIMSALYSLVALYMGAKLTDQVLLGNKASAQACYIISDHAEVIAKSILETMNRGVTGLKGQGKYTGSYKEVLFIVVSAKEIPDLKRLVHDADPSAFMIVSDVREVAGEGFVTDEIF